VRPRYGPAEQFAEKLGLDASGAEALEEEKCFIAVAESTAPPKTEFFSKP
jgi:hypothetical protein